MRRSKTRHGLGALVALMLIGCGGESEPDAIPQVQTDYSKLSYAAKLIAFTPGEHAGYGQDRLPNVVLGPPHGKGTNAASLDVLSLGVGGEIILSFEHKPIIDEAGPDFIVFENAFWVNGNPRTPFVELGEVSVSPDGKEWFTYDCDTTSEDSWPGCAGWRPTLEFNAEKMSPLDPEQTGGDPFDLTESPFEKVSFVRVRDLAREGKGSTAGFDLDAIGVVNW